MRVMIMLQGILLFGGPAVWAGDLEKAFSELEESVKIKIADWESKGDKAKEPPATGNPFLDNVRKLFATAPAMGQEELAAVINQSKWDCWMFSTRNDQLGRSQKLRYEFEGFNGLVKNTIPNPKNTLDIVPAQPGHYIWTGHELVGTQTTSASHFFGIFSTDYTFVEHIRGGKLHEGKLTLILENATKGKVNASIKSAVSDPEAKPFYYGLCVPAESQEKP